MAAVTATLKLETSSSLTPTGLPGSVVPSTVTQSFAANYSTSGTPADQCDLNYVATLTLAATPTILDLKNLTARDGSAVVFVKVRSLTLKNRDTTNGHTVAVGYATTTSNAWVGVLTNPGQITLAPSTAGNAGFLAMTAPNTAGWAVGASSKLLNLDPGANTITVDVEINGTSA